MTSRPVADINNQILAASRVWVSAMGETNKTLKLIERRVPACGAL